MEINKFFDFLKKNISNLSNASGSGTHPLLPDFEILPREYLEFASQELDLNTTVSRINCIAHLKHAMDCQVDILIYSFDLQKKVTKERWGFPKKIEFLEDIGIYRGRSLKKLNLIRNKMEHDYNKPDVEELDIYFDLVSSFIHVLEGFLFTVWMNCEQEFSLYPTSSEFHCYFTIELKREERKISTSWEVNDTTENIECFSTDFEEFKFYLKCLILMIKKDSIFSDEYIISELEKSKSKIELKSKNK